MYCTSIWRQANNALIFPSARDGSRWWCKGTVVAHRFASPNIVSRSALDWAPVQVESHALRRTSSPPDQAAQHHRQPGNVSSCSMNLPGCGQRSKWTSSLTFTESIPVVTLQCGLQQQPFFVVPCIPVTDIVAWFPVPAGREPAGEGPGSACGSTSTASTSSAGRPSWSAASSTPYWYVSVTLLSVIHGH